MFRPKSYNILMKGVCIVKKHNEEKMNIELILETLKNTLNSGRFEHSVHVMETSVKLAGHYGANVEKARLAGLLHDCGRNYKDEEAKEFVRQIGYKADDIELSQPILLHGVIGEHIARVSYGIQDKEILGAVRWHTTGRAKMTLLEKIVFVADYIEPLRYFEGVEELRKAAYENLDRCTVLCTDSTIRYILKNGDLLHEKTIETRNYSIMLIKRSSSEK